MVQHDWQRKEEANRRKHKGQTREKEQTQRSEGRKNDKRMSGRKEEKKDFFSEFNGNFAKVFLDPENFSLSCLGYAATI